MTVKGAECGLNIKQSGIYLSGSLLPADSNTQVETIAEEKPSLSGQLSHPQLSLSGSVPWVTSCNSPVGQAGGSGGPSSIKIQGQLQGKTLAGEITLSSISEPAKFTAEQEVMEEKPEKH